ncbi:MAG: hypothetical protein CVU85_00845 [Firmicutes bacterium HGW-Firmicutes-10]|jgi:uncharacterized protein YcfL|nr:hypothetical protein [Erysipelotrichaceae bacterium]PKM90396.1 MAG: hypothetical protein CVU85_00845 [Firmicutes bacterium HGW-Firmicutes-10]
MKLKTLITMLSILLVLTGCSAAAGDLNNSELADNDRIMPIYLELENTVVTDQSIPLKFTIKNNTQNVYSYGLMFTLFQYDGAKWVEVEMKDDFAFIMIAYNLNPGETIEGGLDLSFFYNELPKGFYRYEKKMMSEHGDVLAFGEFNIE